MSDHHNVLDLTVRAELINTLGTRFKANLERHAELSWPEIQNRLTASSVALRSLHQMEASGGEPDVIGYDSRTDQYLFADCSAQSPTGRRNLCYDDDALESRKANKPSGSAVGVAADMGIELLTESQYRSLQALGAFDTTTSSWVVTPEEVRSNGGALFCDRRYGAVFTYHNGAESYYAARGFRGMLRV